MQVVCGNCQLSFDAPDGATGLVCPICRGPLTAQSGGDGAKAPLEWSGGDLDDLIGILSGPAVSARVEVLPASGEAAAGEVHLLAGGVADALVGGKSTDDALDKLRAISGARFRIEQRLPNPTDGDLGNPGPESGTLEGRPLAHLMRYCEDYVISCSIDVWRGSENARVEYKRGEISGVTVGGIDAPERLAEVMQWASGNYRLVVPPVNLPTTAPRKPAAASQTPAPVPAPAASAQAARQGTATKTIFGMPLAEVAKARAEAAKEASKTGASGLTPAPAPVPEVKPAAPVAAAAPTPPRTITPPGVAAPQVTPPVASSRSSATKTMFGVPAPELPDGFVPVTQQVQTPAARAPEPAAPMARAGETDSASSRNEHKTGARKVSVPAPEMSPPAPTAAPPVAAAAPAPAPAAVSRPETTEPVKRAPAAAPVAVARAEQTEPVKRPAAAATEKMRPAKGGTPVWTWVLVGVAFGVALLGVYYLVGVLAH